MSKNISIVIVLGAMLAFSGASVAADSPRLTDRTPAGVPQHQFGIEVDPTTSIVRILPTRSRDVINSSFTMVSANCTNCGGNCPPTARSVDVVLEATEAVAGGYGVSDLSVTNFSATDVTYSTQGPLSAGPPADQVTITISGDVLACGRTFKVYFSMCDTEPADPADTCPLGPLPATCAELYTTMPVWGQAAQGLDLRARTASTLHWIGCIELWGCGSDFYCNDDPVLETLEFGIEDATDVALRALVDPGDAIGDSIPTSFIDCCSSANPNDICNAPDSVSNGSGIDAATALCNALGYQTGVVVSEDSFNVCPEAHSANTEGTDWTSDWVATGGHGSEWRCSGFLP